MNVSPLSEKDLYLFHEGSNFRSYQLLGAHSVEQAGERGVRFAVWAPHAKAVKVVGEFNAWQGQGHEMKRMEQSGVWALFIQGLGMGTIYKYEVHTQKGEILLKADPYAFYAEVRPNTASVVYELDHYTWRDDVWRQEQQKVSILEQPVLIYEVHLGSWRRGSEGNMLTYRDYAEQLVEYVVDLGYTHIELLPVVEHPFDGSWGYQATGYYAVTSRYGTPEDFMYFVDTCHARGIGVILDWVPGHFCKDDHGLRLFDGTELYEPDNPQRGENYGWGTSNFDFGRPEVHSFLISNALFWFECYHIDGLRVDAVANILYLDYCRTPSQWTPNRYGGNGNLEGMTMLRRLNEAVFLNYPHVLMIAEESTSWPMMSWPTNVGGIGFNAKWNMGWMNDMLKYIEIDPIHRKWNHNLVTFSLVYAFSENFVLPLSHDEVVHGKRSMISKMPGDYWQKFANLRTFYGYWMAHPGKKLLFMGSEFAQFIEWKYDESLDWHLLDYDMHRKMQNYLRDLNNFYRREPSFWQIDFDWKGFEWIDCQDFEHSIIIFMRKGADKTFIIAVCNFTPTVREHYRVGVPQRGAYYEDFNSDWEIYGGSGQGNNQALVAEEIEWHHQPCSISMRIPPLAIVYLKRKVNS